MITIQSSGDNLPHSFAQQLPDMVDEGLRQACRMFWASFSQMLLENWLPVLGCLVGLLALAIVKYCLTRRWGFLAHVLYNYLYAGLLLILVLIFGPEFFASDWLKVIFFLVYLVCYGLVGVFLDLSGMRNRGSRRAMR